MKRDIGILRKKSREDHAWRAAFTGEETVRAM
jgi:hypothetical protein